MKKYLITIAIILSMAIPQFAHASTPTIVQHNHAYPAGNGSHNFTSNITAGNMLLVIVQGGTTLNNQINDPTISDALGNVWTQVIPNSYTTAPAAYIAQQWMYYTIATSSGADNVEISNTIPDGSIFYMEITGQDPVSPISATTTYATSTAGSTWFTNPFNVPANSLVVGVGGEERTGSGTLTPQNGFTGLDINAGQYSQDMYQSFSTASSSATLNASYTLSKPWSMEAIVIAGASSPAPTANFIPFSVQLGSVFRVLKGAVLRIQ